jgi:hypothetical protein
MATGHPRAEIGNHSVAVRHPRAYTYLSGFTEKKWTILRDRELMLYVLAHASSLANLPARRFINNIKEDEWFAHVRLDSVGKVLSTIKDLEMLPSKHMGCRPHDRAGCRPHDRADDRI